MKKIIFLLLFCLSSSLCLASSDWPSGGREGQIIKKTTTGRTWSNSNEWNSSQSTSITTAITDAVAKGYGVLLIDEDTTITANTTTPSTLHTKILSGATVTFGAYDLTINGPFEGSDGCFNVNSTGRVTGLKYAEPEWWGTNAASLNYCVAAVGSNAEIKMDGAYTLTDEILVTDKTSLLIHGIGTLTLSGAGSTDRVFNLSGTIDGLTIKDLTMIGEANAAYYQQGIGNASGQTISNVHFENLKISSMNDGISLNAYPTGTYTKATVINNKIITMVGTASGQGYGIHLANATDAFVSGNVIDGCQRHSIYQAAGTECNNIITKNIISNHRATGATGAIVAAINVARSSGVSVTDNRVLDYYDGALYIAHSTAGEFNCLDILVEGNVFKGRKNVIPAIWVGEQAVPGTYYTSDVTIQNNKIYSDFSVAIGEIVRFSNGKNITFRNNDINIENISNAHTTVRVGENAYIGAAADLENFDIQHNNIFLSGTVLTTAKGFYVDTDVLATYSPKGTIKNNVVVGSTAGNEIVHAATPTNPKLTLKSSYPSKVIGVVPGGCAAGTTDGTAKTTATIVYTSNNIIYSKSATDDFWTIGAAANTGAGEYRKVVLCINTAAAAQYVVGEVGASAAAAPLPKIPHHSWTPVGVVYIAPSWTAGDALASTFFDIVGEY